MNPSEDGLLTFWVETDNFKKMNSPGGNNLLKLGTPLILYLSLIIILGLSRYGYFHILLRRIALLPKTAVYSYIFPLHDKSGKIIHGDRRICLR